MNPFGCDIFADAGGSEISRQQLLVHFDIFWVYENVGYREQFYL